MSDRVLETLGKSKIFSVLTREELNTIRPYFEELNLRKDNYVFMESDPSDFLFSASKGKVKIIKHSAAGKDIILEIKLPGELFCCSAVLDSRPFPESAQAMEDGTVLKISRRNLLKIMDQFPLLKDEMGRYTSRKLRDAHEILRDIASETADKRIAHVLLRLADTAGVEEGGYTKIDFHITRQEIADMIGSTVETCIRMMSRFQKEGMIVSSDNRIMINKQALENYLAQ
ncbi:MAG: Crp/Fnr family transcriptional regulator [Nitrospiraceae bacterium]|nr:MAG: Crp/Fnr family transcriptional regulator [Nitrospiraceae bacterium]